ncbi:hypothetical protein BKA69DRAFT_1071907 [Paraphysoderma sedebokerense]|nr:hypothetical protein BKA69DRAFT_1071907 [Paraphysoderma sedebokerense]
MNNLQLSTDALPAILAPNPDDNPITRNPILQIVNIKHLPGSANNPADRYRVVWSDGHNFMHGMWATQMNDLITRGTVTKYTVVKLVQYVVNQVAGKQLIIAINVEVLGTAEGRIGNPTVQLGTGNAPKPDAQPQERPQVPQQPPQPQSYQSNYEPPQPQYQPPQQYQQPKFGHQSPAVSASSFSSKNRFGNTSAGSPSGPLSQPDFSHIIPISQINPYANSNKWAIRARAMSKSEIRHWSNQKGEGKLFSVVLMDESGEIKATAFQDAVDKFYNLIEDNKVYNISRVRVQMARKQYSSLANDYEITLEPNTHIEECRDTDNVPTIKFNFQSLDRLGSCEKDTTIDVVAIVKECGELSQLISKTTQRPLTKRDLTLVDHTGWAVKCTLWGKNAESFELSEEAPVIAFKGVRVSDFNGKSISTVSSSSLLVNPDIEEAHQLRGWYANEGQYVNYQYYSSSNARGTDGQAGGAKKKDMLKVLGQITSEHLGMNEKPDYFTAEATIHYINKERFCYAACPAEGCNKKVVEDGSEWRCEKCNSSYPSPQYRYMARINVSDHTDSAYLQIFDNVGLQIFNVSATELVQMRDSEDPGFELAMASVMCRKFVFRVKAKMEQYRDEQKLTLVAMNATPVEQEFITISSNRVQDIEEWLQF